MQSTVIPRYYKPRQEPRNKSEAMKSFYRILGVKALTDTAARQQVPGETDLQANNRFDKDCAIRGKLPAKNTRYVQQ